MNKTIFRTKDTSCKNTRCSSNKIPNLQNEEEARAIPELNHLFISWNIYIVPTLTSASFEKKLLRSTTQTDLVVQYNMKQLNTSGEMTGYFNESWSEAEICKSLLDPKELFSSADVNCQYGNGTK